MDVKAVTKYVKISAFKARNVTRHIQGMGANDAAELLRFSHQKAARLVGKTLKSAIANAENNAALDADMLVVKEAVVGEGPTMRRHQPRARGSAGPIRKRTSHIRIILSERPETEGKKKAKKKAAVKKKKASPGRQTKSTKAKKETNSKEE